MGKIKNFIECRKFQNFILVIIVLNAIIMGLQTSPAIVSSIGRVLSICDFICLIIFIGEILLKLIVYRLRFFASGWNIFDFVVVGTSIISGLSFLSIFRVMKIFRVFRSLRAFRMVSSLEKLKIVITAIGRSIPSMAWTAGLLLLIYYIFSIMGVTLFGGSFPDWFGDIGKSMYTLFQVMTLESWSMGISRPIMEVFPWAWVYFVPFVLAASFVIMNVVVGIVVNAISEATAMNAADKALKENKPKSELKAEIEKLREQMDKVEALLEEQ